MLEEKMELCAEAGRFDATRPRKYLLSRLGVAPA